MVEHDLTRRAFVIDGIDSGALVFDSAPTALRYIQLHLGLDAKWSADDMPAAARPTSFGASMDSLPRTLMEPEGRSFSLKDKLGGAVKYTIKGYTLVGMETVEPAFRLLESHRA